MTKRVWLYVSLVVAVVLSGEGDEPAAIWFGYMCLRCQEQKKGGILPR